MARTNTLTNYLTDVASAIKTKKGDSTPILASDFDTEIANIPSGTDLTDYFYDTIESSSSSVYGWVTLIKKIPDDLDIKLGENITNLSYCFRYYKSDIDFRNYINFDTSNVTNFSNLFDSCSATNINISTFDFSSATNFTGMFRNSKKLTSVVLPQGEIICNNYSNMFNACSEITEIDLSSFKNTSTASFNGMFMLCTKLQKIDIRNITLSTSSSSQLSNFIGGVPINCLIIVKEQADKDKILSLWPNYTNIKTVAEYEANN